MIPVRINNNVRYFKKRPPFSPVSTGSAMDAKAYGPSKSSDIAFRRAVAISMSWRKPNLRD
ncbi:hypothetical protein CEPID_11210 [Corynebacterium epidermidicanis]|uniref:Uncharacterized protein n=1 Tax=Corynebacterium epidermidicanis TaxID=1050174 RepID=A0A0G3GSB6_9CORY|nr:hypothetical protein CEPID_11210 [Corynebacterium epidermidicanis]